MRIGLSDAIRQYETALKSAADTTVEVADKQLTPFQKGWAELSGTFGELAQDIQPATDALGKLMELGGRFWPNLRGLPNKEQMAALRDLAIGGTKGDLQYSLMVQERLEQELAERVARTKELADATEDVAKASKRAADKQQWKDVAEIIGGLSEDLAGFGKTRGQLALEELKALQASPNAMRLARDTIEALESRKAAKELDDIIYGLQRERDARTGCTDTHCTGTRSTGSGVAQCHTGGTGIHQQPTRHDRRCARASQAGSAGKGRGRKTRQAVGPYHQFRRSRSFPQHSLGSDNGTQAEAKGTG
jgi:hypothetical protein